MNFSIIQLTKHIPIRCQLNTFVSSRCQRTLTSTQNNHHTMCQYVAYALYCLYTVAQKSIPDIINCNLKKDYQILIILGKTFTTLLASNDHSSFHLTQCLLLHYLQKNGTSEICTEMNKKNVKKTSLTLSVVTSKIVRF